MPYPVLPVGSAVTTTYPCSAKIAGFHLVLQPSSQAPCGPPWIKNAKGYFLFLSKLEGRSTKAWTAYSPAPLNQISSQLERFRPNVLPCLEPEETTEAVPCE